MNEKILRTLEFDKIRAALAKYCSSSPGRELAERLQPETEYETIVRLQNETDEAATVLRIKGYAPLEGIYPVSSSVRRAAIGGMLDAGELLEVASTIRAGRVFKTFMKPLLEKESLPIMGELCERMNPPAEVEKKIFSCIGEDGTVLDEASEKLRAIRKQIRLVEERIREKLEGMIRSGPVQKMLSDAIVTIRNDRFVLPVKAEYRSHFGGFVHDQSASGQTLFIEPESVVAMNNEVRELKKKEEAEIERILLELSQEAGSRREEIDEIVRVMQRADLIFAKAKYGSAYKGSKPAVNQKGYIRLLKARHPLLPADQAVPNDIELGKDYTAIVITGPNTGGKTVTLKTVGLLVLMAQTGLMIPALDGSELSVFRAVHADIGDEQSIEQNLSTFSSHMSNIVNILRDVDESSLVLFDELGAGTDPQEGAALAMAILDEVRRKRARVIATTHYPELKAYSYNREGVINARMEFDPETLSPTYKLSIGVPGRSNAFEISKRLGLSQSIIRRAKSYIGANTRRVDSMIASLEKSEKEAEEAKKEAENYLRDAEEIYNDLKSAFEEYEANKEALMKKAREEARTIVEKAKREAEAIIRDLRELRLKKGAEVKEHELIEAKKRLEEAVPGGEERRSGPPSPPKNQSFHPGDPVEVLSLGQKGYLVEKAGGQEWLVQVGILKMNVEERDLRLLEEKKDQEVRPVATVKGKEYHVPLELDLRGERYEDALIKLEKYLDDVLLAGYSRVSIIHGKGTGALREGVQKVLRQHPSVKSFRYGTPNEGGIGKTIVELK